MGSEGPSKIVVHVTGFKKFHGVSENPTEIIVKNLEKFMQKKGFPEGLVLASCNVLETAGEGALPHLKEIFQNSVIGKNNDSSNREQTIWLHLGVNSGATKFAIEKQAVNEATFRCPDEMGWKPLRVPIEPSDGSILRIREITFYPSTHQLYFGLSQLKETSLPVNDIVKVLSKKGYDVVPSDDAGRFVCNFVYYHSLQFAEQNRIKSLFVHVPLFLTIDEDTQMEFMASLLEVLASLN